MREFNLKTYLHLLKKATKALEDVYKYQKKFNIGRSNEILDVWGLVMEEITAGKEMKR